MKFGRLERDALRGRMSVDPPGGEGGGGGGGGGTKTDPPKKDEGGDLAARIKALEEENARLKSKAPREDDDDQDDEDDEDLMDRARRSRAREDKSKGNERALEAALRFNLKSKEFLEQNEALLPKDVPDIFAQAEKENYSNAIAKDAAIKAGIIKSFFSVQANVDMLTPGVKAVLDDYLKLTNTGKQDKAQQIYDTVFEPTFEALKKVKKAEALARGYGGGTAGEDAYKKRLQEGSKKHYLGEKRNA